MNDHTICSMESSVTPTLVDWLVCVMLPMLSQFTDFIKNTTGLNGSLLALAFALAAILAGGYLGRSTVSISAGMVCGFVMVAIVCLSSLVQDSDIVSALKPMLLVCLVFIAGPMVSAAGQRLFVATVLVLSVVITVDAILNVGQYASAGLNLYNVRNSTMVDKPAYTIMYALSITFIIVEFRELQSGFIRLLAVLLIMLEGYIGFVVIESKTFLVAVALASVIYYVVIAQAGRGNVLVLLAVIMGVLAAGTFLSQNPELIPDSVRSLLSNVLGIDIAYSERYNETYIGRRIITETALSEFVQHPITGIGFGNFLASYSWNGVIYTVKETESSWLSFLTEGGILYFVFHAVLNGWTFLQLYRTAIRTVDKAIITMLLVVTVYIALNIVNDYANNFYWCSLAVAYGQLCEIRGKHEIVQEN